MNLTELHDKLTRYVAINERTKEEINSSRNKLESVKNRIKKLESLQVAVQQAAQFTQNKLQQRFTDIVQSCLDVVFPDKYKFKLEFVCKRGKTEVEIYLDDNGSHLNPMTDNGGGVVDVISFAIRVAALTLSSSDKILLLDEPFKCVRGEARNRLGQIVEEMSKNLGIQIIMVADVAGTSIHADKIFEVTKPGNSSLIKETDNETTAV